MRTTDYDIIVIGAGPGGYETAASAAASGLRVMLAERGELGGTCLNRGCIPTKALCRSAEVALTAGNAASYGIDAGNISVDYRRVAERKDEVVRSLREAVEYVLGKVDVVHGDARLLSRDTVEVNGDIYVAPKIIIATGSRPTVLDIPGAELCVDSDFLLSATELPESIAIIGGGVIGMEFASVLNAFGVDVTVLEYSREILPGFDADVAKRLRTALKRRGISIVTGANVVSVEAGCTVNYELKGKPKSVGASMVLMAVGRRPVLPDGLRELGVALDRGFIAVDDSMATNIPGIYAVGDVNGRCLLAHAATLQGQVALGHRALPRYIPGAVFSIPECASVGLTEDACLAQGLQVSAGQAIYRASGKAMAMGEPDGMVKMIVDRNTGEILGCHICGAHAADMVQEVSVAMECGITACALMETVHIHPTLSELLPMALNNALR